MKIIVTGCSGFIGSHLCKLLLNRGDSVIGIDSVNSYYDPNLKQARLILLQQHPNFTFYKGQVEDQSFIQEVFKKYNSVTHVVHLAAQAGVRYSLIDPYSYIHTNILGHVTLLEAVKKLPHFEHFIYASSSSVYGANTKLPFSIEDRVDQPISLYAASKRAGELISNCYSHLFSIPQTGFRFFTVYGPWGRPDMAAFLFTKGIIEGNPISVYNHGNMRRNFTYIDDIIQGLVNCIDQEITPEVNAIDNPKINRLYNLGNNRAENLMDFIRTLEDILGKKALLSYEPIQPGDVKETIADITTTQNDFGFMPKTHIAEGLKHFVKWYRDFYQV